MGWVAKGKNKGPERGIWVETSVSEKKIWRITTKSENTVCRESYFFKNWTWWNRSR